MVVLGGNCRNEKHQFPLLTLLLICHALYGRCGGISQRFRQEPLIEQAMPSESRALFRQLSVLLLLGETGPLLAPEGRRAFPLARARALFIAGLRLCSLWVGSQTIGCVDHRRHECCQSHLFREGGCLLQMNLRLGCLPFFEVDIPEREMIVRLVGSEAACFTEGERVLRVEERLIQITSE